MKYTLERETLIEGLRRHSGHNMVRMRAKLHALHVPKYISDAVFE